MRVLVLAFFCFIVFSSSLRAQPAGVKPFELGVVDQIKSVQLSETRILNVYLPNGYKDTTATYPVIYLLDGSADEDFVHIVGLVQFLTMIGKMPKSIVVGIANVDRRRDFTFPTKNAKDFKMWPTTGKSERFINFIEKELQPYIQKNYRTNGQKTIVGQSLGGLLATEILLKKPELFNNYVIVSPSLWWDDESLLANLASLLKAHTYNGKKIYISVGAEGKQMEGDAANLSALLKAHQVDNTFFPMPAENHLTILHNSAYKAFEVLNQH